MPGPGEQIKVSLSLGEWLEILAALEEAHLPWNAEWVPIAARIREQAGIPEPTDE